MSENNKDKIKKNKSISSNQKNEISANRRQIAVTSFDLLNGEYSITERNRRTLSIISIVGVIVVIFLGYQSVSTNLSKDQLTKKELLLNEKNREINSRFTQTSGIPEGITQKALLESYDKLEKNFEYISYVTAFPFDIIKTLRTSNIYITSVIAKIVYSKPKENEEPSKNINPDNIPSELLANIDIEKIIEEESIPIYYKISATATTALELAEWAKRVRDAQIFNEMLIVSSGNIYTIHGIVSQNTPPQVISSSWGQASLPTKKEKQEKGTVNEVIGETDEEN